MQYRTVEDVDRGFEKGKLTSKDQAFQELQGILNAGDCFIAWVEDEECNRVEKIEMTAEEILRWEG